MEEEAKHNQEPGTLYHQLDCMELLDHARDGDANALEQLYYQFRDPILKYVWLVSGQHEVAVQTVKQVFTTLFSRLDAGHEIESIRQFLFQLAEQIRIESPDPDPVTAQSGWELASDTLAGEGNWTGPSTDHEFTPSSEQFVSCFSRMPEPLRASAGLYLLGSFSVDDIMSITRDSADAIRARIDEALRRLRVCLQQEDTSQTRTHTNECSMASERTWLQFHSGDSNTSNSSNLVKHRNKCEECETVSRGIKKLNRYLNDFHEIELSPFPKGDESDLLDNARKTAANITNESPASPEMDPDLKQVLWLIPWGLGLVFFLSITPLAIQKWNDIEFSFFNQKSALSTARRTVFLDPDGKPVKRITIRVRGRSTVLENLQVQSLHKKSSLEKRSNPASNNNQELPEQTYIVTFTSPYPTSEIRMLLFTFRSNTLNSADFPDVRTSETTDPNGQSISARVYLKR